MRKKVFPPLFSEKWSSDRRHGIYLLGCSDIAADELAQLRDQFRKVEGERAAVEAEIKEITRNISGECVAEVLKSLETLWEELFPAERYRLAHLLVGKIVV